MFHARHVRVGDQKEILSDLILPKCNLNKPLILFFLALFHTVYTEIQASFFQNHISYAIYKNRIKVDHVIYPQPHHLPVVSQSINQVTFTHLISQKILMVQ